MRAAVLVGPGRMELAEVPMPDITADQVLVKVKVCGICASEVHTWQHGPGERRPLILGHEPMGVVEAVGSNVRGIRVGDRVTGLFQHAFAEYSAANACDLVRIPDSLDDLSAIGEPLSCLVSGSDRTPVALGDTVAIVGLGFMGLGFLQLMKLKGASKIIAIDVRQESLDNALRYGADEVYFPGDVPREYKVLEWGEIGQGVDVAVEASGSQAALDLAGELTAAHGTLSIVGFHQAHGGVRNVRMDFWNWKAITVVNAHERRNAVHIAAMKSVQTLIQAGRFNMRDLITHEFSLADADAGYRAIQSKPPGFIKSVVRVAD